MAKQAYTVGQRVICNGHEGVIRRVCTGQLTGMYEVRLPRGEVCVDGQDLKAA